MRTCWHWSVVVVAVRGELVFCDPQVGVSQLANPVARAELASTATPELMNELIQVRTRVYVFVCVLVLVGVLEWWLVCWCVGGPAIEQQGWSPGTRSVLLQRGQVARHSEPGFGETKSKEQNPTAPIPTDDGDGTAASALATSRLDLECVAWFVEARCRL